MPFCASCGSEVQGRFCAQCGTPSAAQSSPPPGGFTSQQSAYNPPPGATASAAAVGLEENVACALCYLLGVLTGVLFLVLEPYNKNKTIRFHAFQSIFAWLACIVAGVAVSIFASTVAFLPLVGWLISLLLWIAFPAGVLVLWLMLMYKAYNRERWVLPIIGPMAEKQA